MSVFSLIGPSLAVAGHCARALGAYRDACEALRSTPAEVDAVLFALRALEAPYEAAVVLHARERTGLLFDAGLALARDALAEAEGLLDDVEADDEGSGGSGEEGEATRPLPSSTGERCRAHNMATWLTQSRNGVGRREALQRARSRVEAASSGLAQAFALASALYGPLAPSDPCAPFSTEPSALECAQGLASELDLPERRERVLLGLGETFFKPALFSSGAREWSAQGKFLLSLESAPNPTLTNIPDSGQKSKPGEKSNAGAAGAGAQGGRSWQLCLRLLEEILQNEAGGQASALLRALEWPKPLVTFPLAESLLRVQRLPFARSGIPDHNCSQQLAPALAAARPVYTFTPTAEGSGGSSVAYALVFEPISPPAGLNAEQAQEAAGSGWPFAPKLVSAEAVDALLTIALLRPAASSSQSEERAGAGAPPLTPDTWSLFGQRSFVGQMRRLIGEYRYESDEPEFVTDFVTAEPGDTRLRAKGDVGSRVSPNRESPRAITAGRGSGLSAAAVAAAARGCLRWRS
mmetsp:Transcript_42839/g.100537  ORF Transcript_42839/g.100537 Transcript_42839/m.100537 type:complete len:522 (+) Transcript_42839:48-1613(+)